MTPTGQAGAGVRLVLAIGVRPLMHDDGGAVIVEYRMAQADVQSYADGKEVGACGAVGGGVYVGQVAPVHLSRFAAPPGCVDKAVLRFGGG